MDLNFSNYLLTFFVILIITYPLYKIFIKIAKKNRIIDIPDLLSSHQTSTVTSGGIVMYIVFICSLIFLTALDQTILDTFPNKYYLFIFSLSTFVFFAFIDDIKNLHHFYRLLIQFSLVLISSPLFDLNYFPFDNMIKLNLIIYLYFFIYLINIINFTDGVDGFLTLNSITFFSGVLLFQYFEKKFEFIFVISLIIIPILLIFMIYNKPKAKIFMGDSGSIFLAYLIGFCSIELIILGKWHIVISLLSYTFLDCTITLIKKTIDGHAPWARLFDYYFLKPIRINKKNNFLVFRYNLIYNFLNLTIVFFQVYLDLKYLFVLSIAFSLILMNKYKNFSNN